MTGELFVRRGGTGDRTLLLLHGLGATGEVWQGLTDRLPREWNWVVPDLPGHGRSAPLASYSFGELAAAIAKSVSGEVTVVGHSLGGVVALTLASGWFGAPVPAACGLGIKVSWSEDDLAKAAAVAAKPARVFATREEAADRWLKVSGLVGLVPLEAVSAGVVPDDDGWRVALDQGAFSVGAPDMRGLLAAAGGKVVLAAGERDPMCQAEHLRELVPDPVVLPGLGHNAHVEDPAALLPLLDGLR
ncbi:alpha/beta fold hydrolase [Amycolatopsis sp. YIM 10]|uniref:alpha/beta fold hydrolase n=1 Tax=Amycolatopsis sp. YIM 10 TaxID=2653857 RepID=UPI00129004B0|nr:alpha/beta hydrolase [Amycolatopsis sp. YIM 10]QFU93145.1 Pimeloyl-[acyl-carrier protein] methyl ester esterase [Amycolatopsis sp. YIM 10]